MGIESLPFLRYRNAAPPEMPPPTPEFLHQRSMHEARTPSSSMPRAHRRQEWPAPGRAWGPVQAVATGGVRTIDALHRAVADNMMRAAMVGGATRRVAEQGMAAGASGARAFAGDAMHACRDGGRWAGRNAYSGVHFVGLRVLRDNLSRIAYAHSQAQRYVAEMVDCVLDKMVVRKIVSTMGAKMRTSGIPPGAPRCLTDLFEWVSIA